MEYRYQVTSDKLPLWPVFMSYVLSFIYVGIHWDKLQYANCPSSLASICKCYRRH